MKIRGSGLKVGNERFHLVDSVEGTDCFGPVVPVCGVLWGSLFSGAYWPLGAQFTRNPT